jgi:hypothetical protein
MNFNNNFNPQRNSNTLDLEDNDLLEDEWLYSSKPFDRTDTFRRKVKTNGDSSRNSILEWLATDDDKADNIASYDDNVNNQKSKKNSIDLFDNNDLFMNSDSIFEDDLDISNLDSKFMNDFKLVSQNDFEDTEIEESLTKNNESLSTEFQRSDSPNSGIIDSNKIKNNETINIEDYDSDSNMTIINSSNKNKMEGLNLIEKNTEIVNVGELDEKSTEILKVENQNKIQKSEQAKENKIAECNTDRKSNYKLAHERFQARVEEAKKTLENLKPRKNSLTSSEKESNLKTQKFEENEKQENDKKDKKNENFNKKKIERRSYYYYADTGSDDENEDKSSSIKINNKKDSFDHGDNNNSSSFKKTYNYFNSGGTDSPFYGDKIYNNNENNYNYTSSAKLSNKYSEDFEDYPRKPPAPSAPSNGSLLTNLIDHANFESQPNHYSDIETESNSSLHSDLQPSEYYINQSFSNYGHSKSSLGYYSTSPRSPVLTPNNLYTPSSPSLNPLNNTSFIPTSPSLKPNKINTSFIPTSPSLKPNKMNTSLIPTSPSLKPNKMSTSFIPTSPNGKSNTSFIPTSPSLKASSSYRPSSPTIGKYSSSLYNKQVSHIASPRIGYSSPSSTTSYSKSYESRTYDPVAPTYSIKDLINNKTPQALNHSSSINSSSSISSSSTYKPTSSYSRKSSLEQTPQLKNYLNRMATTQRSKSPSMLSTTSTSSSKYSSGRKTPNSRLGSHYAESTASSTSSSSKVYSKYINSSSSSSLSKIGSGIPSSVDRKMTSNSSTYGKSLYSSDISSSSKISYSNGGYSGRKSKTPTPSNYNKSSIESRIPSPSPYTKRSITPYY